MSTAADDDPSPNDANDEKPPVPGGPPPLADNAQQDPEAKRAAAAEKLGSNPPDAMKGGTATVALGQGTMSEKDEKTFGMLVHILGAIPLLGPLVLWMLKREESPFVNDQGKEAVSFQFIIAIAFTAVWISLHIPIVQCATWALVPIIYVVNLIMVIMAGLKAGEGIAYRYPFALRVL